LYGWNRNNRSSRPFLRSGKKTGVPVAEPGTYMMR
jgi:hypothetical protein